MGKKSHETRQAEVIRRRSWKATREQACAQIVTHLYLSVWKRSLDAQNQSYEGVPGRTRSRLQASMAVLDLPPISPRRGASVVQALLADRRETR